MAILRATTRSQKRVRLKAKLWSWVVAFALFSSSGLHLSAQQVSKEYQIKAAFLYNFSQFVEWPAGSFANAQAPLIIGVIGDDPFGSYLDDLVKGEKVNNHPLAVQRFHRVDEIKNCHVLFVSRSEAKQIEQILSILRSRNILTVGDFEDFAQRGGMIRFITENNKIRFRINVGVARAAKLTISSKLLRAAEIVNP
ncbi:MAG TPA: YfiR family protein [Pyrinomonadaceae bacterium]|jgi:hypothetical protein|nr:YfiR family protein [Pyrinomonadaceae bacterium]